MSSLSSILTTDPRFDPSIYDFRKGTFLFTQIIGEPISDGISKVSSFEYATKEFKPSHVLIVLGWNTGFESHLLTGVKKCSLHKYIDNPKCRVVPRQIKDWSEDKADGFLRTIYKYRGSPYDLKLIFGLFLTNTIGILLNEKVNDAILRKFDAKGKYICTELVIDAANRSRYFTHWESTHQSPVELFYNSKNFTDPVDI